MQHGSGAAAFFVIESGTARVLVDGEGRRTLGPGAHFVEMALLDAGAHRDNDRFGRARVLGRQL